MCRYLIRHMHGNGRKPAPVKGRPVAQAAAYLHRISRPGAFRQLPGICKPHFPERNEIIRGPQQKFSFTLFIRTSVFIHTESRNSKTSPRHGENPGSLHPFGAYGIVFIQCPLRKQNTVVSIHGLIILSIPAVCQVNAARQSVGI